MNTHNNVPKITLTAVKYMASLSEETNCFTATVNIDGKPAFAASNHGHGGMTDFEPLRGQSYEDMHKHVARVEAYAATLPPHEYGDMKMPRKADDIVDELVDEWLLVNDYKKLARKAFVLVEDGKIYTLKYKGKTAEQILSSSDREKCVGSIRAKNPKAEILNLLPIEQAAARYIEVGRAQS